MVPFRTAADNVASPAQSLGLKIVSELTTPVSGDSVASQLFIYAAATPPFQGGEYACPAIHSHVLTPWIMSRRRFAAELIHHTMRPQHAPRFRLLTLQMCCNVLPQPNANFRRSI